MDNNNFNNDPNNAGAQENPGTAGDSSYSQYDPANAQQNPYGANADGQQGAYGAYGNQQNGYSAYGNQQNGYGAYGSNQQNGYGTYGTAYNTCGTVNGGPVDDNGKPLKNNFAMKLTFSILEIISCNLISLVMGILGCVFTTKANNAYKEGRWEDFKSAKKTSTIVLWVGLVGVIISVIATIVMTVGVLKSASDFVEDEESYWSVDWDDDDDDSDYGDDQAIVDEDVYAEEDDDSLDQDYAASDEPENSAVTVPGDIDFEDTVIYDSNGVTVTATSISWYEDYDGNQYPEINVVITNSSDKDVTVNCEYLSINGVAMPYASIYSEVTAGMSAKDKVDCDYDDVWTYCDFDEIEYFSVCLNVYDSDYNDLSDSYDFVTVPLTDDYGPYGPDDSQMVLSQDGFDIYYLGTVTNSYEEEQFVFYIFNNGDRYVHADCDKLAVDGFMQKSGYDYTYLYSYDGGLLFANADDDTSLSDITSASIQFEAYDATSYDDLLDTDNVDFVQ
jgi:hypothetical protein